MTRTIKNITVLGSGRWGTAMAIYLSRKDFKVTLQCHFKNEYEQLIKTDRAPNLPNYSCDKKISFVIDFNEALRDADMLVISTPVAFLRGVLEKISSLKKETVIVSINKGIENESLLTVPEIIRSYLPGQPLAHLGGPCFPEGLLSDKSPAAETIACEDEELAKQLQDLFSTPQFRVYRSHDLKGVAILGAIKNIYAIAAGIAEGFGMFEEATAVLVTRGLAEMKRFCQVMGISQDTLYGLSGLGDLALTCYSMKSSHNKNFGKRLGSGESLKVILETMEGKIAEGYYTTKALWEISRKKEIELPLCNMVYQVIYQNKPIKEGLLELMNRPLKVED
ncbi:MAG: NAD(P)-dependent glycerol-3-phosphate dehydrogenase [Deltaproteobacteria bacterium]|nr:NAD(P)-dependent glycerol-3-phosphate dehydrogenase [Deltaproteobacteria bacterium]